MVSLVAVLMVLDIDFPDMVVAVNAELVISYCELPSKRGKRKWSMQILVALKKSAAGYLLLSTYLRQKGLGLRRAV